MLLLLFAMIRSVVKSFKVPGVEVVASRMSNEAALTPICQMKDLPLGGSTTCMRESLTV